MKKFYLLLFFALAFLLAACKGTSPAGPPSPPAEIPGFIIFPDSLEVSSSSSSSSLSVQSSQVIQGNKDIDSTTLTALIALGEDLQQAVVEFVAAKDANDVDEDGDTDETIGVLAAYSDLKIPTHPDLEYCSFNSSGGTCYDRSGNSSFTDVDGNSVSPQGTTTNTVLISFKDFDLEGDGELEACTGDSCPVDCSTEDCSEGCPSGADAYADICIRIWSSDITATVPITDILPTLAMRMDRVPCNALTGETDCLSRTVDAATAGSAKYLNPGQGEYRAMVVTADKDVTSTVDDDIDPGSETVVVDQVQEAGVLYDHRASDDSKLTDVVLRTERSENDEVGIDVVLTDLITTSWIRGIVYQDMAPSGASRTEVSADYLIQDDSGDYDLLTGESGILFGGDDYLTYISRLLSDRTLWSGYTRSQAGDLDLTNTCAEQLGTSDTELWSETSQTDCQNAGIDVAIGEGGLSVSDHTISSADISGALPDTVDFPADNASGMYRNYCLVHTFSVCP